MLKDSKKVFNIETSEIILDENSKILLSEEWRDGYYNLANVTYQTNDDTIYIGCFRLNKTLPEKEWLEYNSKYIAILKNTYGYPRIERYVRKRDYIYCDEGEDYVYLGDRIIKLFDINSKQFVDQISEDELEDIPQIMRNGKKHRDYTRVLKQ